MLWYYGCFMAALDHVCRFLPFYLAMIAQRLSVRNLLTIMTSSFSSQLLSFIARLSESSASGKIMLSVLFEFCASVACFRDYF